MKSKPRHALPATERAALTIEDAISYASLGRSTIYHLLGAGEITGSIGGGRTTILRKSLDDYLARTRWTAPGKKFRRPSWRKQKEEAEA